MLYIDFKGYKGDFTNKKMNEQIKIKELLNHFLIPNTYYFTSYIVPSLVSFINTFFSSKFFLI